MLNWYQTAGHCDTQIIVLEIFVLKYSYSALKDKTRKSTDLALYMMIRSFWNIFLQCQLDRHLQFRSVWGRSDCRCIHTPLKHFHSRKRKCDKLAAVALVTQSPLVRSEPPLPAVGTAHLSPTQPHYPISKPLQRPPHHWSLMSLQSACEYVL